MKSNFKDESISKNNISHFKTENNNQDQVMSMNKDYDNMSSQNILKPRLININDNIKRVETISNCLYSSDFNEEVSQFNNTK
jgi:hypothetical protein